MDFARFLVLTHHRSEGQLGLRADTYLEGTFSGIGVSPDALGGAVPRGPSPDGKAGVILVVLVLLSMQNS